MSQTVSMTDMLFNGFLLAAKSLWWLPLVVVFSAILKTRWFKGW
jgi:hypothetical protein